MSVRDTTAHHDPDTAYTPLQHPDEHPAFHYKGFHPGKIIRLPKGHVKEAGFQAFLLDVIWEVDQAIPMRDGVTIYADVFRPASEIEKVPAIIPWSPYGKAGTSAIDYDTMGPWRIGIPYQRLSGYETFEGPNPAEWCSRGYAIVDIDARGAGNSEGDLAFWGKQEAIDIYDSITWAAKQPWCNGSVVMMGNSWLAVSQLNFASRFAHPNLKAIAPWEGLTDLYAHQMCRGGIPKSDFGKMILGGLAGFGKAENVGLMLDARPLVDEYWMDKKVNVERIRDVPMYLTASYSTGLHCEGSFHAFERSQTSQKWLRVHSTQEWHDIYKPEAMDDLQRFYDYFAKGIENGWEKDTPRVRLSLLGYDGSSARTVVERPEDQWPLARQCTTRYYLNAANSSLEATKPSRVATATHEGHSLTACSDFKLIFDKYTEVCGRPFVKLFMSCSSKDDFDVVIQLRKISSSGELLESLNWSPMCKPRPQVPNVNVAKHLGQQGMLRASHHVSLGPRENEEQIPVYDHRTRQPITPGSVVPLLIAIWPVGMVFEAGEGLILRVSGHDMSLPEVESMALTSPADDNIGHHNVWTGGNHQSYLVLPTITK
ncbi:Alpha/Beta hydrolase protein [Penicillium malachiteum]|uniref:Alpha/Beta hydrolase protein n=1 Tax=Penicillium malachiteum TaxID=1324776 RepID=UPI0025473967|nr:Alpha/Beta hydrolase protein [Penicillium malachiteum]KAJ5725006.1 Alpha/Beta hydrolase protein [Penicillium malachiteum]